MKKLILTALCLAAMSTAVVADEGVSVYSNGKLAADNGIIIEGRTMVPVRGVFENLGYTVEWNNETKTAELKNEENTITIKSGEAAFTVNDNVITPDVPQQIVEGRFMLPLRAVGEAIDAKVEWDNESKTAYITKDESNIIQTPVPGVTIHIVDPDSIGENVNEIILE